MLLYCILLLLLASCINADISGTNPAAGSCLCFSSDGVRVRNAACGTIIGSANTGQCFKAKGRKETCSLDNVPYEFFNIDFGGQDGWSAGDYLNLDNSGRCDPPPGGDCSSVQIVSRATWGARPPKAVTPINVPVTMMFIHHTAGPPCFSLDDCSARMRGIQNYHMDTRKWNDIGYSWLVGEDGRVYEGRGWGVEGAHTSGYNSVSHAVSVMGNFVSGVPNNAALAAVRAILQCGIDQGYITSVYELFGHRDGGCTTCPGDALYAEIRTWPEYSSRPLQKPCL